MLQIICFSFNRAMQLDTMLTSFKNKWIGPQYHFDVIYNYSNDSFADGYRVVMGKYENSNINFHKEEENGSFSFQSILKRLLNESLSSNVMFLTDDSLFVKDINLEESVIGWLNEDPYNRQYSFRMGKDKGQLPDRVYSNECFCYWDVYNSNPGVWGQPFSIIATIYNKTALCSIVNRICFNDPSAFLAKASNLVKKNRMFGQAKSNLEIKVINISINVVRKTNRNIHQDVSPEILNVHFLDGETMRYVLRDKYDSSKQYVDELLLIAKDGKESLFSFRDKDKGTALIENISLVLSSCDKYEDTWHSFFIQLVKNWPDFSMPIYLGTETKQFSYPDLDVKCPLSGGIVYSQWSERLIKLLKFVESDYVLFMLDDFWLTTPVDTSVVQRILGYMNKNPKIGFVCLRNEQDTGAEECEYPELRESMKNKPYRITTQAGLWRKDYLIKILKSHESAWNFETRATWRSRLYRERVFDSKFNFFNYPVGGTIGGGKLYKPYLVLYSDEVIKPCLHRGLVDFGEKRTYPQIKRNLIFYWNKFKSALP